MNLRLRTATTPLKRVGNSADAMPNLSSSIRLINPHVPPPRINNSHSMRGQSACLRTQQRIKTQFISTTIADGLIPKQKNTVHYLSSLKTQKRQYLKLFTEARTVKKQVQNSQNWRKSSNPARLTKPFSYQDSRGNKSQQRSRPQTIKLVPRRRLFGDLVIEEEQKIQLDSQENGQSLDEENLAVGQFSNKYLCKQESDASSICWGCLKFIHPKALSHHQTYCKSFQILLTASPEQQIELIKQAGLQLICNIEKESGELVGLADYCSAFLKECDLAWSSGRPSEIYNFKLRALQMSGNKLVACMNNIHQLSRLLELRKLPPRLE